MQCQLFDPLRFLERQLFLDVYRGQDGGIYLQGIGSLPARKRKQAKWVLERYRGLLLLQLDAPKKEFRPSVQKLLAQGKISIQNKRYVLKRSRK
jgi:hypothetical protein